MKLLLKQTKQPTSKTPQPLTIPKQKTSTVWGLEWVFNKVRMVISPYSCFEESFKTNSQCNGGENIFPNQFLLISKFQSVYFFHKITKSYWPEGFVFHSEVLKFSSWLITAYYSRLWSFSSNIFHLKMGCPIPVKSMLSECWMELLPVETMLQEAR